MKVSNVILLAMVVVGSSAFAARPSEQKSNSECAHSDKGDKLTDLKSNYVKTVFSQPAAPARGTEKGDGGAVREKNSNNG